MFAITDVEAEGSSPRRKQGQARSLSLVKASTLGCALALALGSGGAAEPLSKPVLRLVDAMRVVDAVRIEAAQNGWPCVVAVVDDEGWLITMQRMDRAPMLASVELAPVEARSAAVYRRPTAELDPGSTRGVTAVSTASGRGRPQGGLPLTMDDQVVGAVGVSTDDPVHDRILAETGARALGQ